MVCLCKTALLGTQGSTGATQRTTMSMWESSKTLRTQGERLRLYCFAALAQAGLGHLLSFRGDIFACFDRWEYGAMGVGVDCRHLFGYCFFFQEFLFRHVFECMFNK